tara:strand:- start:267 stop:548 length:282 start_codon:yes stop_codon:yes gene_type:complete
MDPSTAITYYGKSLNPYEQSEILNYETIYFLNIKNPPKQPSESEEANNFGFDNDKNEYISEVGQHIAYQYEIQGTLGKGSFGCVFKCFDHKSK